MSYCIRQTYLNGDVSEHRFQDYDTARFQYETRVYDRIRAVAGLDTRWGKSAMNHARKLTERDTHHETEIQGQIVQFTATPNAIMGVTS